MSKNGKYSPEDSDVYITLFVLFCWLVVSNFASVLKMDYNHVVATVASYLYAGTTLMQYSYTLLDRYPQDPHTIFHKSSTPQSEAGH